MNVLFVCIGNSGRSVMAERLFRRAVAGRHETRSAGAAACGKTAEPPSRRSSKPCASSGSMRPTTSRASFDDPRGRPIEDVRPIRDAILERVEALAAELR